VGPIKDEKSKVYYVIGSMLSTDGTNSLLMNSPVWTGIFELEFGMDSSTTCAMMIRVGCRELGRGRERTKAHPEKQHPVPVFLIEFGPLG
jgi:hypothetical protein